jgi:hypothetical protein
MPMLDMDAISADQVERIMHRVQVHDAISVIKSTACQLLWRETQNNFSRTSNQMVFEHAV